MNKKSIWCFSLFLFSTGVSSVSAVTYASSEELPPAYQHSFRGKTEYPEINLDALDHHNDVPKKRLDEWKPAALKQNGFMTLIGLNFLEFSENGFVQQYSYKYDVDPSQQYNSQPDSRYFFSGFWDTLWLSGSLVNKEKYPACGSYGLVLDIPPELILKTYQLDSTTMTHGDLLNFNKTTEQMIEYARNYLKYDGHHNSRMMMTYDDRGLPMPYAERIYAPGETIDSPAFMTPQEMITRGRPNEHNEIKFMPMATYQGQQYSVKITGIWYQDEDCPGGMFVRKKIEGPLFDSLAKIAMDLNLPLITLSQKISIAL